MGSRPSRQRKANGKILQPSSFVANCLATLALESPFDVLDLPCGTGRHISLLASLGCKLTVADIDKSLTEDAEKRLRALGCPGQGIVVDASKTLPFVANSFDLVLVVDFVDEHLLANVGAVIKSGGYLIYESYPARGANWIQLLPSGRTVELLSQRFKIIRFDSMPVGPTGIEAEVVRILARRL